MTKEVKDKLLAEIQGITKQAETAGFAERLRALGQIGIMSVEVLGKKFGSELNDKEHQVLIKELRDATEKIGQNPPKDNTPVTIRWPKS